MDVCKQKFRCFYEEKDAIGKRYRRMDAIGTPFCVTVDHQTKEDGLLLSAIGIVCSSNGSLLTVLPP
jgi:glycyl-tRNA synthetase (class II)